MRPSSVAASEAFAHPHRAPRWALRLPWIAAVLLPIAIGLLLWLVYEDEREEQRAALVNDALWIEQYLRFHMDHNIEQLGMLAAEAFNKRSDRSATLRRANAMTEQHDGVVQVAWLSAQADPIHVVPKPPLLPRRAAFSTVQIEAFDAAARTRKPVYSGPYEIRRDDARFDVYVPHYQGERLAGMTVGTYSTTALLNRLVPWWFTERYRITLIDKGGVTLSTNFAPDAESSALSHQLAFEPLGQGAMLKVTMHRHTARFLPSLLMAIILLLAAVIVVSVRAVRRHIQRRQKAEQALREEYAFRRAMEDSLLTGLRARDMQGRIIYVNPAFCRMVGWSAEELVGRAPPMPYWISEQATENSVYDRTLADDEPHEAVEIQFRRKNGERFDALIYEAPLIDADGRQTGWMGSVLDITARKRTEELYRQQQEKLQFTARLITMGEMASVLAHELNQPLSAISSYTTGSLNVLQHAPAARTDVVEALHKVVAQAKRAGQVVRRVHEFVRRREPRQETCLIGVVIEDAIGLFEPIARQRRVRLETDLEPQLPALRVDRVMIEQVLLNLMRNGMDAMDRTESSRKLLHVSAVAYNRGVRITVADRGAGISADATERLYEPFFSTKPDGMGVGLSISRSIVELHRGRLWFEPRAAGGTQFHFWLPEGA